MVRVTLTLCALGLFAVLATVDAQVATRTVGQLQSDASPAQNLSTKNGQILQMQDRQAIDPARLSVQSMNVLSADRTTGLDPALAAREGHRTAPAPTLAFGGPCPCPAGATVEAEACGDEDNDGCSAGFCGLSGFVPVSSGDVRCGTVFADGGMRDLDYYSITFAEVTTLTLDITSSFPATTFVAEDPAGDCSTLLILDTVNTDSCISDTFEITLRAGTYYVVIAAGDAAGGIFDGITCAGGDNEYSIEFNAVSADCLGVCTGQAELEACGTGTNDGCVGVGAVAAESLATGVTVCGTTSTDAGADVDYYEFEVFATEEVTLNVNSEVPTLFAIATANCIDPGTGVFAPEFFCGTGTDAGGCNGGSVSAILSPGTYYALIGAGDGFGFFIDGVACTDAGNGYEMTINTAAPVAPCSVIAVGTTALEPEACGDDTNGGCNSPGGILDTTVIDETSPQVIEGTAFADCGLRDLDWYVFTLFSDQSIDFSLSSEMPMAATILSSGGGVALDCGALFIAGNVNSQDCVTASDTINLVAGEYIMLVLPENADGTPMFDGFPCGYSNDYVLTTEFGPLTGPGCTVTCPGGSTFESELCGDSDNDGCIGVDFFSEDIGTDPSGSFCGQLIADTTRDFDVYTFTLSAATEVSFDLSANLPTSISIAQQACALGGWFVDCDDMDIAFNPGDCSTTSGTSQILLPGVYEMIVTTGGSVFGICPTPNPAIFSGFPCGTSNDYTFTISIGSTPDCFFPTGGVTADCAAGTIDLDLLASSCYNDIFYELTDPSGTVTSGTINGPIAAGDAILESVPVTAPGVYDIAITANCCNGDTDQGFAAVGYFPYNGETDIIVTGDLAAGCIDSTTALKDSLEAAGRTVLVIDLLSIDFSTWECGTTLDSSNNIWVQLGSFPNNLALFAAEGQAMVDYMTLQGVDIFIEGGDVWGFDALTPFADFDGVAGRSTDIGIIPDGDDSFTQMNGVPATNLDTSGFGTVDYNQDSNNPLLGDFDWTDQLLPSGDPVALEDEPAGSLSELIWTNSDDSGTGEAPYGAGIAYAPVEPDFGSVIAQSFEFGGFAASQDDLAVAYLGFFAGGGTTGPLFRRGDSNNDGGFDISDAVFTLAALFTAGSPSPACADAGDANDDGGYDISDAVYTLASLFTAGAPAPVAPGPGTCGEDPTMDGLGCNNEDNCP